MAKLGEVCTIVSGSTPKTSVASYWDGNIKWITPAELNEDTFYIMDSVRHITEEGKEKTGLSYLPTGTVILSSRAPIGKTAIAGCEMCCNQGFKNLICSDAIYNEYLYFFLKSKTDYLNSLGRGATFKEISKSIVESIEIPLPEVNQQKEIAEKFKKLEQLISLRKQQLAKLDELVKVRFVEMFGEPAANPNRYKKKKLSEIAVYFNGLTYKPENVSDEGMIVLRSSNIQNGQLDFEDVVRVDCAVKEKFVVKENDILMCSRNGSSRLVGKVALIKNVWEPMSFGAFMMIIRSDYYWYLMTYFQMASFREQIKAGTTTTINQITGRMLDSIMIPLPPVDVQNQFATFAERVDQQKQTVQQSLEKLELMKKALMQEYFG